MTRSPIYSDERNHASIIDGCRAPPRSNGARLVVYPHRDLARAAPAARPPRHPARPHRHRRGVLDGRDGRPGRRAGRPGTRTAVPTARRRRPRHRHPRRRARQRGARHGQAAPDVLVGTHQQGARLRRRIPLRRPTDTCDLTPQPGPAVRLLHRRLRPDGRRRIVRGGAAGAGPTPGHRHRGSRTTVRRAQAGTGGTRARYAHRPRCPVGDEAGGDGRRRRPPAAVASTSPRSATPPCHVRTRRSSASRSWPPTPTNRSTHCWRRCARYFLKGRDGHLPCSGESARPRSRSMALTGKFINHGKLFTIVRPVLRGALCPYGSRSGHRVPARSNLRDHHRPQRRQDVRQTQHRGRGHLSAPSTSRSSSPVGRR
jgi:hypothetical protein